MSTAFQCPFCKGRGFIKTVFSEGSVAETECIKCGGAGQYTREELRQILIDAKVIERAVPDVKMEKRLVFEAAQKLGTDNRFDLTNNPYDYDSQRAFWREWNRGFTIGRAEANNVTSAMKGKKRK